MAWTSIPNFGDPYAKVNERTHSSGARLIEVLYGARDSAGRPTSPTNRDVDGHGHWLALEIDGTYQMLSWRHSAQEGGGQEYGRNVRQNALYDLERDIAAKESLCGQAETLARSSDWRDASVRFKELFEDWKKIYHWGTPREKELWERFRSARQSFYDRRGDDRARNRQAKQDLILRAREAASSQNWKEGSQRMRELFEAWKRVGPAGKPEDDQLWADFNAARQSFYDRRARHFAAQEEQREHSRRIKLELIDRARAVVQGDPNWKAAGEQLAQLMEEWKRAGSAGKERDDQLWGQFNGIRQDFFDRKKRYFEEQSRRFLENAARKSQLVQEAAAIAASGDYSRENTQRMKDLDQAWKGVGSAGRNSEEQLWPLFREAKERFWAGKRAYSEQRQQEWRRKLEDAIQRKRDQIRNLENQIDNLNYKMNGMRNQEYIDNMCRWIDEKQDKIAELEAAIQDMERKLYYG